MKNILTKRERMHADDKALRASANAFPLLSQKVNYGKRGSTGALR